MLYEVRNCNLGMTSLLASIVFSTSRGEYSHVYVCICCRVDIGLRLAVDRYTSLCINSCATIATGHSHSDHTSTLIRIHGYKIVCLPAYGRRHPYLHRPTPALAILIDCSKPKTCVPNSTLASVHVVHIRHA